MCPYGGYLWDGVTPGLGPATIVCHCLLIEAANSLVLVDTGFGLGDVARPRRLSAFFRNVNRVQLDAEQTARRQIERLGLRPDDVRHIVLTHLDFDHAGGIEDFPNATVHVMDAELRAATLRPSPLDRQRYRPAQWDDAIRWQRYRASGERWFGFECVRDLAGLPPEILMVPLAGHTVGHAGIAIRGPDRLEAARRRRLFLPRRDGPARLPLHADAARLPEADGSRSRGPARGTSSGCAS